MNINHTTPDIKAIIFDMDGLIFDSERVVKRSWDIAGEMLALGPIGSNHIHNTLGFNVVRREQYFKGVFGEDFPMERFNQITRKVFREIADTEGVAMKPGVIELLKFAKENGIRTAVATSSRREHSSQMLQDAGIWSFFDGAVFGDMVANAKPDPEIYIKAANAIHAAPVNCIALEDSPAGIQSSHAAGMYPIMIPDLVQPTDEIKKLCWKKFKSLNDVVAMLKA
ncbi:HAD family hydrolase [Hespellia stercorisuis]|uniref:Haloacid dehalogenase superfamily, subfamily IA, variant 3 with third motif having DD or ED n=1 Tax=Hespellia stercorisuis DSM 15480 TaxID=1121950 RepID=A0A1M6S4I5_9FIRM|nr:HAD family phosphatase [Hespellia stercorisuis]SHK39428.1 haloacid dehalogenase superfamily, subfamily IA, variant 3 with third motif having DD or ED [Hespellia stercorisuis DSM 15480]